MRLSISILFLSLALAGCSGLSAVNEPPSADTPVSFITGKPVGTNIASIFGGDTEAGDGIPVNAILWRAALDVSALVVIEDVDVFSGTILTSWHTTKATPNKRVRLAVFVVGRELRSDGVRVVTYAQERRKTGAEWGTVFRDAEFSRQVENLILNRARQIRAEAVSDVDN